MQGKKKPNKEPSQQPKQFQPQPNGGTPFCIPLGKVKKTDVKEIDLGSKERKKKLQDGETKRERHRLLHWQIPIPPEDPFLTLLRYR